METIIVQVSNRLCAYLHINKDMIDWQRYIEKGACLGTATVVDSVMIMVMMHMLIATYIWYSSIASTNCPHESKSVPFLKLACHF